MQALDELNRKLGMLLKKHAALETENKRLRDTVARFEKTEDRLTRQLTSLEKDMVSVRMSPDESNGEERENMRRQLDMVITEIDRILNTLND